MIKINIFDKILISIVINILFSVNRILSKQCVLMCRRSSTIHQDTLLICFRIRFTLGYDFFLRYVAPWC